MTMSDPIVWQLDSTNPDNAHQFNQIDEWWQSLNLKQVSWQQRLVKEGEDLDWEAQRFDETLTLQMPQIRGITLYWHKASFEDEHSITPQKLILDPVAGTLDIYPQSQANLVIRITKLGLIYQKIEVSNPLMVGKMTGDRYILLLRDKGQKLEIKIDLSQESLKKLLDDLPQQD